MALQEQKRRNDLLWMLLGILLVAAIAYFYSYPQIKNWQTALINMAAKEQDALAVNEKINTVQAKSAEISQNSDIVNQLDLVAPDTDAEDGFVATIESIAENSGVTINFFQPNSNADGLEASLNINGSFLGIGLFLQDLHRNLRPVKVLDLRITSVSAVEGAALLNATMRVIAATSGLQGGANGQ